IFPLLVTCQFALAVLIWFDVLDPPRLDELRLAYIPEEFGSNGHPLARIVKDIRPEFELDPSLPYRIEFGQGSGWHGLDTVKITSDGKVIIHVAKEIVQGGSHSLFWETGSLSLSQQGKNELVALVA